MVPTTPGMAWRCHDVHITAATTLYIYTRLHQTAAHGGIAARGSTTRRINKPEQTLTNLTLQLT